MGSRQLWSAVISIATGITVALLVQGVVLIFDRIDRQNEIEYISRFFETMETELKAIQEPPDGRVTRAALQSAYFRTELKVAELVISARSSHLSNDQHFEMRKLVQYTQGVMETFAGANRHPADETYYEAFFDRIKALEWLGLK